MDSINNPEAIKAILQKLQSSQVWRETINTLPNPVIPPSVHLEAGNSGHDPVTDSSIVGGLHDKSFTEPTASDMPSVASLLLQLQPSNDSPLTSYSVHPAADHTTHTPLAAEDALQRQTVDVRNLTFQEALPHLVRLSEDPSFVSALRVMKTEQADLERRLWEERRAIQRSHEDKVKMAQTKADMLGGGISQYQADVREIRMVPQSFVHQVHCASLASQCPQCFDKNWRSLMQNVHSQHGMAWLRSSSWHSRPLECRQCFRHPLRLIASDNRE